MTRDAKKLSMTVLLAGLAWLTTAPLFAANGTVLIDHGRNTTWKYHDEGTDPGGTWQESSFDDAGWKSGPVPMGFNEEDLGTRVGFGGEPESKPITTYFRRGFQVSEKRSGSLLVLIRCDDGAVVYLNGKELARANLREGAVTRETTAIVNIEGHGEKKYRRFVISTESLIPGKNVLAVEVHQASAGNDDLFFDLLLKSYTPWARSR